MNSSFELNFDRLPFGLDVPYTPIKWNHASAKIKSENYLFSVVKSSDAHLSSAIARAGSGYFGVIIPCDLRPL